MTRLALFELRRAIREFVPVGGLRTWNMRIRLVESMMQIEVAATVPDRISGRDREIVFRAPARLGPENPREYLREVIREFVLHEADEGIGFRKDARPTATWTSKEPITSQPVISAEVERPFDPHRLREISAEDFRTYMRTGQRPKGTGT